MTVDRAADRPQCRAADAERRQECDDEGDGGHHPGQLGDQDRDRRVESSQTGLEDDVETEQRRHRGQCRRHHDGYGELVAEDQRDDDRRDGGRSHEDAQAMITVPRTARPSASTCSVGGSAARCGNRIVPTEARTTTPTAASDTETAYRPSSAAGSIVATTSWATTSWSTRALKVVGTVARISGAP